MECVHNNANGKTLKKCNLCYSTYTCKTCKGLCIYSDTFPNTYYSDKKIRKFADEKYFPNEMALLKTFINLDITVSEEDEDLKDLVSNKKKKKPERKLKLIDYLIEFQNLSKDVRLEILKQHQAYQLRYNGYIYNHRVGKYKGTQLKACYYHYSDKNYWGVVSRNEKKSVLYQTYVKDIVLR